MFITLKTDTFQLWFLCKIDLRITFEGNRTGINRIKRFLT